MGYLVKHTPPNKCTHTINLKLLKITQIALLQEMSAGFVFMCNNSTEEECTTLLDEGEVLFGAAEKGKLIGSDTVT